MTNARKPSELREKELRLALLRILHGRSKTGATKLTVAAVAREAEVSTSLIHNHYPKIAEAVRNVQGKASRNQRDIKRKELQLERKKNLMLRQEVQELTLKLANLASINEELLAANLAFKAELASSKAIKIIPKTSDKN
ncbi:MULTISPECIES: TetR family transcriptional regulator [unclassified Pseudomonas]|uniref:TetR family transcriptional regulator n=1 Tax=unclassified Pseudomonas TaxID=196821 RepID=UPI000A1D700A|nr:MULTISPECIES: TetR family transcriptional regulator [unclassified Pseudomonas]